MKKIFSTPTGIDEFYACLESQPSESFGAELTALLADLRNECGEFAPFWLKFHLSDPTNQFAELERQLKDNFNCCVVVVGQAPASGARIGVEVWGVKHQVESSGSDYAELKLQNYVLKTYLRPQSCGGNSYVQTMGEFNYLMKKMAESGETLVDNLLRTWLYCRDVDNNYDGLVRARRDIFYANGLTQDTHYVASTGIEGTSVVPGRLVTMQNLVISGHENRQITYLAATDYLSPTHVYGVTFERGTKITYGDRSCCYISGTASIDRDGKILHERDVAGQTRRLLENVAALLTAGRHEMADLSQAVIYLRDPADYRVVSAIMAEQLHADMPRLFVRGSVCRPGWLVEMEAISVKKCETSDFPIFK